MSLICSSSLTVPVHINHLLHDVLHHQAGQAVQLALQQDVLHNSWQQQDYAEGGPGDHGHPVYWQLDQEGQQHASQGLDQVDGQGWIVQG